MIDTLLELKNNEAAKNKWLLEHSTEVTDDDEVEEVDEEVEEVATPAFIKSWETKLKKFDSIKVRVDKSSHFGAMNNKIFDDENIDRIDLAIYIYISSHLISLNSKIKYLPDFSAKILTARWGLNQRPYAKKIDDALQNLIKYKYIAAKEIYKINNDTHYEVRMPAQKKGWTKIYAGDIDQIANQAESSAVIAAVNLYAVVRSYIWETISNDPIVYQKKDVLIQQAKITNYLFEQGLKLVTDREVIVSFLVRKAGTGGHLQRFYSDAQHLEELKNYVRESLKEGKINEIF